MEISLFILNIKKKSKVAFDFYYFFTEQHIP